MTQVQDGAPGAVRSLAVVACAVVLLAGCGSDPSTPADTGAGAAPAAETSDPCRILTQAQVAAVLPDADSGFATTRGRSLIEGVRQYQCTYTDPSGGLFGVAFDVAETDELFESIKPGDTARQVRERGAREVEVGDGGWLLERANGSLELRAVKNRTSIYLELGVPGSQTRADALIEAARVVAATR